MDMDIDFRDALGEHRGRLASPKQENKGLYSVPTAFAGHVRHNSTSSDSSGPRERTSSLYVLCFVTVPERASVCPRSTIHGRLLARRRPTPKCPGSLVPPRSLVGYHKMLPSLFTYSHIPSRREKPHPRLDPALVKEVLQPRPMTLESPNARSKSITIADGPNTGGVRYSTQTRGRATAKPFFSAPISPGTQPPPITSVHIPSRRRRGQGDAQNNGRRPLVRRRFR